ncbi:Cytochrome P450 [Rhynchospora pubera]|uniref:Cytochrome P450 n=1 Tax=Rhynchospora pubera TaxID=906938 RepID=A0AAV8GTU7_9POAL|nr:Cytochrome P450 [Rhynchospora pubera]
MDITLPYLTSLGLLVVLSLWFLQKRVTNSKLKFPRGPWTLPFIGSLHHFAKAGLPHHALHNLSQLHGPVMLFRLGEIDLVVLSSREAAKEVMKTQDATLANRPVLSAAKIILYGCKDIGFSNGPYWRQMRRISTTELFSSKQVKSFSSIRKTEIHSLMKTFSLVPDESPVNLSAMTSELSNNIILRAAFGGTCKNRGQLLQIIREASECFSGLNLFDLIPSMSWLNVNMRRRLIRLRSKLDLVLEEDFQEHLKKQQHRKKGGDEEFECNFVDVLIVIMGRDDLEEPITMDSIKAVLLDVFAGAESTAITITWAMSELIKHPEVMEKVQAEIRHAGSENNKLDENSLSYLKLVIKETLRMHPPGPLLAPRQCMKSCQILGYTIPSGARLVVNAWALGRNSQYWNDPEEFKPERFETLSIDFKGQNFEFVPFGAGRRMCPGLEFGMAVVEEALASLLLHFDWKLPDGMEPEDLDMTETLAMDAAKKEPLYLIPTLRIPLPHF